MDDRFQPETKRDLIIAVWEELDCDSVGEAELHSIQQTLRTRLGEGAVDSPAAIARILAEEGATLRHPEVLRSDSRWREAQIEATGNLNDFDVLNLKESLEAVRRLTAWRKELKSNGLEQRALTFALNAKKEAELIARSKVSEPKEREVAEEVAQWLTVWLQNPELFEDWVGLRMESPEYLERFK
jgi:hypothetical protein